MKRAAGRGKRVDTPRDLGVLYQWRSVVWFEPGINDERPSATPVLLIDEGFDAVDVGGWIRPSERYPQEIAKRFSDELAIVDDDNPAKASKRLIELFGCAKTLNVTGFAR